MDFRNTGYVELGEVTVEHGLRGFSKFPFQLSITSECCSIRRWLPLAEHVSACRFRPGDPLRYLLPSAHSRPHSLAYTLLQTSMVGVICPPVLVLCHRDLPPDGQDRNDNDENLALRPLRL